MSDIFLVRHGETAWNRELRFQGQIDVPLNDLGLTQAQRLADRLRHEWQAGFDKPLHLVSSDLQRAHQTASALGQALDLPITAHAALREQHFGLFEGLLSADIQRDHADVWHQWLQFQADFAIPGGGESTRQFHARVCQAVRQLAHTHADRTLVIVTHGGVLDMLWRSAQGIPLDGPRTCDIPNVGLNQMRWVGEQPEIVRWADTAHLDGLPEQPSFKQRLRPLGADSRA